MKLTTALTLALTMNTVYAAALQPRHCTHIHTPSHAPLTHLEILPALANTSDWSSIRKTASHQTREPIVNVTSPQPRCNELQPGTGAPFTQNVTAGDTLTFKINPSIQHPGPLQFYLAKAPRGKTAATWDGAGQVWFKIYAEPAIEWSTNPWVRYLTWASQSQTSANVTIPSATPEGEYLLRIEHLALHNAAVLDGAQFHVACAQIRVLGGGDGKPGPLVAFPGAYVSGEKGLMVNMFNGLPAGAPSYTPPGPPVWSG